MKNQNREWSDSQQQTLNAIWHKFLDIDENTYCSQINSQLWRHFVRLNRITDLSMYRTKMSINNFK